MHGSVLVSALMSTDRKEAEIEDTPIRLFCSDDNITHHPSKLIQEVEI